MDPETRRMWVAACGETETWKGQCYGVACAAVDAGIVDGLAVYGHWLGPVRPGTFFYERSKKIPFISHGWIRNGVAIVDPTRWVFAGMDPFIWAGPLGSPEYDEGGNQWIRANERPCPGFSVLERTFEPYKLPQPIWDMVDGNEGEMTLPQVFWLANLSLLTLGDFAPAVYQELERIGMKAAVPLDNWRKVIG